MLNKGGFLLADLSPSLYQKRVASAIALALGLAFLAVLPYAAVRWPAVPGFVPTIDTILFFTDLTTAVLLYAQFAASRTPALLVLAAGYLLTALLIVAHLLTFPGTFSVPGLLGANPESTVWLYIFWHFGLPPAVLAYTVIKRRNRVTAAEPRALILLSAGAAVLAVAALVILVTTFAPLLPPIMLDEVRANRHWQYIAGPLVLLLSLAAMLQLWRGRISVLDMWLLVVLWAWFIETLLLILTAERYSLFWYTGRICGVLSSSCVLLALLYESTMIYARLATAEAAGERERESKRLSLEVTVGSIAHELRQPLTAILANCYAGQALLAQGPPDLEETRAALAEIEAEGLRASEIISSIQTTLTDAASPVGLVDVGQVVRETVGLLRAELQFHEVAVRLDTPATLPGVHGNKGQLLQVMVNLITNAVFAMRDVATRARVLNIRTQLQDPGMVSIQVEDSGMGISPELHTRIFDPLFTTKGPGNGLGLTICRSIIEAHAGKIAVLRSGEQGSCLQILLPVHRTA